MELNSDRNLDESVSIIVPTYREAESLPDLIRRLEPLRQQFANFEVIVVDDNSQDGTEDVLRKLGVGDWVQLIIRTKDRGLSASVIDGCKAAKNSNLVVMDADLSHPPEAIPKMIQALSDGADFVIGSRYCEGGRVDHEWGLFRKLNSLLATLLARPFTRAKDPMSGFLALRRSDFLKSSPLNPIGYKIGLEFIVKCGFSKVREVPIYFQDRQKGESKLTLQEQLKYLRHIKRLTDYKFGNLSFFLQFALVGTTGFVVNEVAVTIANLFPIPIHLIFAIGILAGMICTFLLNRNITFNHGVHEPWPKQFVKFAAACSLGILANYGAALAFVNHYPQFQKWPQVPVALGAIAGMFLNFVMSRYVIFRKNLVVSQPKAK